MKESCSSEQGARQLGRAPGLIPSTESWQKGLFFDVSGLWEDFASSETAEIGQIWVRRAPPDPGTPKSQGLSSLMRAAPS